MIDIRKRLRFLVPALLAYLVHHTLHETTHYVAARLLRESVAEFRFLTNGWLTSRVVYATPLSERVEPYWLIIAWAPAVVTTLMGLALFATRKRWLSRWPFLNAVLWFLGAYGLVVDPFYFAVLSIVIGGWGDVGAVKVVGWSPWPVRLVALVVLTVNVILLIQWRQEASEQPARYLGQAAEASA
jgi:hypothetical protein